MPMRTSLNLEGGVGRLRPTPGAICLDTARGGRPPAQEERDAANPDIEPGRGGQREVQAQVPDEHEPRQERPDDGAEAVQCVQLRHLDLQLSQR